MSLSTRTNRNWISRTASVAFLFLVRKQGLAPTKFRAKSGRSIATRILHMTKRQPRSSRDIKFANLKCKCHARFRGVCVVAEFLLLRRELKPVVHGTRGLCKVKNKCNEAVASYSDSSLPDQARLTLKRNFFLRRPS